MIESCKQPLLAALACVTLALSGCALQGGVSTGTTGAVAATISGRVHGGQQPVTGATIQLYAASTSGYGSAATPLLVSAVITDARGQFSITGDYTCPANALVYITATGGNPGLAPGTSNAALAMMAPLGACSALTSSTFININELTTVAAAWSLSNFLSGTAGLGVSPTNVAGLTTAFSAANVVVNVAQGTLPGTALPANATLPIAEIDTLANILAGCINSAGGVAGDSSLCGQLFTAATPAGGPAPTDTLQAAINIARNPATNVAALFALGTGSAPFQPALTVAPNNFMIGIRYTGGGLSNPSALALDASGNVWIANRGNASVTQLSATGATLSPSTGFIGGGLNSPAGIAVATDGTVWLANKGGNSVSRLNPSGTAVAGSPYTGGGLGAPSSVAFDADGNAWIANAGNGSLTEFSGSGATLSPSAGFTGGGLSAPIGIAVNPH